MVALRTDAIVGKTVRWTFSDGPTKGATFEHVFHNDGSVSWREASGKRGSETRAQKAAVVRVSDDVQAVSYLSDSGYTLTLALNFSTGRMVGFASNEQSWYPVQGTFEVVG